jgi:hypothetical protein
LTVTNRRQVGPSRAATEPDRFGSVGFRELIKKLVEGGIVRGRWWAFALVVVLAACWGGAGYLLTKPTDHHDYRKAAVQAAQSAYGAVETVRLTGEAELDGRLFPPYVATMMNDARKALAGAAKKFTSQAPPDDVTIQMRDRLAPLLVAADARLGDAQNAAEGNDDQALRELLDPLGRIAEQLSDFLEAYE